jgi:hypothetical protein
LLTICGALRFRKPISDGKGGAAQRRFKYTTRKARNSPRAGDQCRGVRAGGLDATAHDRLSGGRGPASLSCVSLLPDPERTGPEPAGTAGSAARRDPPPPLEANDQLVTGSITVVWAVAAIVLLIVRGDMPAADRWWVWVPVTGLAFGLFALWYVPHLKRGRQRAAERRAAVRPDGQETTPADQER